MMKVMLDCSNQYINTLKRKLNRAFEEMDYVDTLCDTDCFLLIKEVKSLKDMKDIETYQIKNKTDIACLIDDGEFLFELLEFRPLAFIRTHSMDEDLDELIKRMQYKQQGIGVMLEFQCGYQKVRINAQNITFVESYAHYLLIHTINSTVKVREKISAALKQLQPYDVIQVHRSFLVNKNYIQTIDSEKIVMLDSQIIPIGKKYKQQLRSL